MGVFGVAMAAALLTIAPAGVARVKVRAQAGSHGGPASLAPESRGRTLASRLIRPAAAVRPAQASSSVLRQPPAPATQPPAPATQPPPSAAQPPPSAAQPPAAGAVDPAQTESGAPGLEAGDLSLPVAERAFGGGEPTSTAETGEAAAEQAREETRGLLMKALNVPEDADWRVFGWIQNSFTGNANGYGNGFNFGVYPNFKANQWMGNQYYLIFENPIEQNDRVNWGFRIDNILGNDWQFNFMQGFLNGAFRPGQFAGYEMAQLYGSVHLPVLTRGGLDVKGGRWYTLAGYETVPAVGRPLLSAPYMLTYGPFTHVGVVTTLHVTDRLNLHNGTINGWDRWINERYIWGYIGGFSWTSKDARTNLSVTCLWGPNQFPSMLPANQGVYPTGYVNVPSIAGLNNPGYHRNGRTLFTTVLSHKWSDRLTHVIEADQGWERSIPGLGANEVNFIPVNGKPADATWYGLCNWFLYNFNDKVMGVWRSEIFWDQTGVRTGLVEGNTRQARLVGDRFYEMTLGARIKPREWLWIRPEVRYDWSQFHPAYSDNTRKSQLTMAFDVIVIF